MPGSLTLGRIRGIPIRVHFTLLFILPYLAFVMAAQFEQVAKLAGVQGRTMLLPPVAWGILLAIALFGCVLLHELGHSLVALHQGGRVSSITLMMLGGISELKGIPRTPRREATMAAAGPLVSFALGLFSLALYKWVDGAPDIRFGFYYLGQINIALGVFNLLPAFPMDGGRVLRALLSTRWPRVDATRIAATTGVMFAALFVVFGLLSGNFLLMLIGFFVWSGGRAEQQMVEQDELMSGLFVRDVMTLGLSPLDASAPITEAAARLAASHTSALPVMEGPNLVGVISAQQLEFLAPEERERMLVSAVVERNAPQLDSDDPLRVALERLAEEHVGEAPVLHEGHLVGILDTSDLARVVRLRSLAASPARGAEVRT